MLKSTATALGIILDHLAITGVAVAPSQAQKLRTSIPCQPIAATDHKRCHNGHIVDCRPTATKLPNGECNRD